MEGVKKELYILGVIFFALVIAWNIYDYRGSIVSSVRPEALAAAQSHSASLSVTVAQSITLTQVIGATVAFGTLTPGTPVTGKTGLQISTNGAGMNITAGHQKAIANATLASGNIPVTSQKTICDQKSGCAAGTIAGNIIAFAGLPCAAATWVNGTSLGLGFSVYGFTGGSAKAACWGTGTTSIDPLNKYAALQASASASSIISSTGYTNANTITSVGYKLDVSSSQQATSYNGGVVYTATSTP